MSSLSEKEQMRVVREMNANSSIACSEETFRHCVTWYLRTYSWRG